MKMEGWEDRLHSSFLGEHVLFTGLRLESFGCFLLASVLTVVVCFAERSLTLALSRHWSPFRSVRRSRVRNALWRTLLYWLVTLLRLLYMLISMTFHVWLILIIVSALSIGQFTIECLDYSQSHPHRDQDHDYASPSYRLHEPLLSPSSPLADKPFTRPRAKSKSKPASLFIHPNQSNLSRADAAAVELGLHGSTERVKAHGVHEDDIAWEHGKGRDVARELLGRTSAHARSESQQKLFRIADGQNDEEDEV